MGKVFKFNDDKKNSKQTNSTESKQTGFPSVITILGAVGFFASICIAVALVFRLAFNEHSPIVAKVFQVIGETLAYIVCLGFGFTWTRGKEKVWWLVCWVVSAVVITVVYIFAVIYTF